MKSPFISDVPYNENQLCLQRALTTTPADVCSRCRNLGVLEFLFAPLPQKQLGVLVYGHLGKLQQRKHCPFCVLVMSALKQNWFIAGHQNFPWGRESDAHVLLKQSAILDTKTVTTQMQRGSLFSLHPVLIVAQRVAHLEAAAVAALVASDQINDPESKLSSKAMCGIQLQAGFQNGMRTNQLSAYYPMQNGVLSQHGRPMKVNSFDTGLLRMWVDDCLQNHASLCFSPVKSITRPLLVVDVTNRCVVETPSKAVYLALSYVWGSCRTLQLSLSNLSYLYQPGSLSDATLPRTITDAMTVVARLGEQYLWVDALCIPQDNAVFKAEEINRMGDIYAHSLATLVAVDGADSDSGLPGVRVGSRCCRQDFTLANEYVLMTKQPDLATMLELSPWNRRGWTLQERLLSRRCIFFTQAQIYFQCKQAYWTEDSEVSINSTANFKRDLEVHIPHALLSERTEGLVNEYPDHHENIPRGLLPQRIEERLNKFSGHHEECFEVYKEVVNQYVQRQLTYDTDIFNAFYGAMQVLQPCVGNPFLAGLPAATLHLAFLWQHQSRGATRRILRVKLCFACTGLSAEQEQYIPSWSWAGWRGNILYPSYFPFWRNRRSLVQFHCLQMPTNDKFVSVQSLSPAGVKKSLGKSEYALTTTAPTRVPTLSMWRMASKILRQPPETLKTILSSSVASTRLPPFPALQVNRALAEHDKMDLCDSLLLAFWADSTVLKVTRIRNDHDGDGFHDRVEGYGFRLTLQPGVGWLSVGESRECEFIAFATDNAHIYTLLIEWKDSIAYRLDLTVFRTSFWTKLKTLKKIIVLG